MRDTQLQQQRLQLDSGPMFDLQHGGHIGALSTAIKGSAGEWQETRPHLHSKAKSAIQLAAEASQECNIDAYVSQCGISSENIRTAFRSVSHISALPSCWVDLDYYHTEYRELSPDELLETIRVDVPWLPQPTTITDSGRGVYLHWIFNHPLYAADSLPDWQKCQDGLTGALKQYGADPCSIDAARVLRIIGSVHTGTGRTVKAWDAGSGYSWPRIRDAVNLNYWQHQIDTARDTSAPRGTITWIQNGHTRSHRALNDIRLLAQLRAPATECRERMLVGAAMVGSWFCRSNDALLSELDTITQYYAPTPKNLYLPEKLPKLLGTILRKADRGRAGETIQSGQWAGKDVRYTPGKKYLIDLCEISRGEQTAMQYLIGDAERQLRYRRKNGVKSKAQHLADARSRERDNRTKKTKQQAKQAQALRAQGMKQSAIAETMGISKRTVIRYLKQSQKR